MHSNSQSTISCRLTDRNGNILNPFAPHAITYTEESRFENPSDWGNPFYQGHSRNHVRVRIEGYVTIFEGETCFSPPMPFCIEQSISLFVPKGVKPQFRLKHFHCYAMPIYFGEQPMLEGVTACIEIETYAVCYQKATLLMGAQGHPYGLRTICYSPQKVVSSLSFQSHDEVKFSLLLPASICQYTALSDGIKREYTNQDAVPEYHGCPILSPDQVSYYNLFVNGVLQPQVNYRISEGLLEFLTADLPPHNVPIVLEFITFSPPPGQELSVSNTQYITISDGSNRIFRNQDALPIYSNGDIPDPTTVSYYNLYSNGALQPPTNYRIQNDLLELTSSDLPLPGSILILECIRVISPEKQLLQGGVTQYNAKANPCNVYTNCDELRMYGHSGIPSPTIASYQHLNVNGAMQPQLLYSVHQACLCLYTQDTPPIGAPIILQSVCVLLPRTDYCS